MHALLKMVAGTLCSRILGFLRDIIFFAVLGASLEASAFLIAFAIPNLFRRLCGEGALNSAFIPVFAQRYVQKPASINAFLNAFFSRFGVYLGSVIFFAMLFLGTMHHFLSSEKWTTVLYLMNAMLPYLWFICMAALLNGTLNVLNAFSLTAFSPVLLNLSMLLGLGCCTFYPYPMLQVRILSVCVILGGLLQWYLPKFQLRKHGIVLNNFSWHSDPDLKRIWYLFLPSVLGAAIFQINAMLGRFFAYVIDAHAVSFLYLANRFLELPLGLFVFSIISIILPKLSLYNAQKDYQGAKNILIDGIQLILLLLVPASIGLYLLAQPILDLCFRWGNFSTQDILQVVPLLKIFALGLPIFGLTSLFTRIFYAHKDTSTPVKLSCLTLVCYILCFWILAKPYGILSLALASVISSLVQLFFQIKIIQKHYPFYTIKASLFFGKKWLPFLFFTIALIQINAQTTWVSEKLHGTLQILSIVTCSILLYLLLLRLFDKKSFHTLIKLQLN